MQFNLYILFALWALSQKFAATKTVQKRQLYREQVSPQLGGKIPDSAFHTDRLALNQLQKVGIAIPDGVILEQRNPEVYQYSSKTKRPVYKVKGTKDLRPTPKEGRYKTATTFDTTYVIPQISQLEAHDLINVVPPTRKQLAIPHSFSKGHQSNAAINNVHPTIEFLQYWPYGDFDSYLNLVYHPSYLYGNFDQGYYIGSNIFNDFATFFDTYVHHH